METKLLRKWAVNIFFAMASIESLLVTAAIYGQRSHVKGYFLNTGLTGKNFLLVSIAILISILAIGILIISLKDQKILNSLFSILENDKWYLVIFSLNVLILFECVQDLLFISSQIKSPHYSGYLLLLFSIIPYLYFGTLFSIQTIALIIILRSKDNPIINLLLLIKRPWLLGFCGLSLTFILVYQSGFGYIPYSNRRELYLDIGHLEPTQASLIGEQVFIVFSLLLISYLLIQLLGKKVNFPQQSKYIDWIIVLVIWILAYQLWINIPIVQNYFTGISGSPNNTLYPISDAYFFDKEALSLLNKGEFINRTTHVLYSFFLAVLHKLKGPDYLDIIGIQIGFLAFTPVLLYKITEKLHTRFTGVLVAVLYIVRERNGLQLSNILSGTVVNQLMTEPYGALCVIAFLYVVVIWLRHENKYNWYPVLVGSIMGVSLLIRAELLAILLAVCAAALIYLWNDKKRWFRGMIQIWVVIGVITIPWMSRNYLRTGIFTLDKGNFVQKRVLEYVGGVANIFNKDSGEEDVIDPVITDPELLAYIPEIKDVPNHFISSTWQSLLYLPSSHQPLFTFSSVFPSLFENDEISGGIFSKLYNERYVRSSPYFWYYWDGKLENRSVLSITVLLMIVSLGIWRLWKEKSSLVLFLPLAFISHILLWSLAGYSGGRFTKPSDWISLVFYGMGLVEASSFFIQKMGFPYQNPSVINEEVISDPPKTNRKLPWFIIVSSLILVIFGFTPVLSEIVLPDIYTDITMKSSLASLSELDQKIDAGLLDCFINEINDTSATILYGKALYPRYFDRGETLEDDRQRTLPDSGKPRLDYYMIGQEDTWVSLALSGPRIPFAHYSDVIALGEFIRNTENDLIKGYQPYFDATAIYIFGSSDHGKSINKISITTSDCDLE